MVCAVTVTKSAPSFCGLISTLPNAWTQSMCISAGAFALATAFFIASTGSTEPTSLFMYIILTSIVSLLTASKICSVVILPYLSGIRRITSNPCFSSSATDSIILSCSMAVVTMRLPFRLFAAAVPNTARLFASVPPEVKNISSASQDKAFAMCCLAFLISAFASNPAL